jgi:HK97 family phage portal protein
MAGLMERVREWFSAPTEEKALAPYDMGFSAMLMGWNRGSKSNVPVTVDTALQVSAVLACVRVIAEGLAQVPCKLVQYDIEGHRREAREHPLWRLLYRQPNSWQSSFEFRETVGFHLALCGNAFVYVVRDRRGRPEELLPFAPQQVSVEHADDFSVRYRLVTPRGRMMMLPAEDVWHLKGASWSSFVGLDVLAMARNAVGLSISAEEYASELFANGARPQGILTTDADVSPERLAAIKAAWQEANSGTGNRFKTVAMTNGLKWQAISGGAQDTQMIEARRFQIEEIARAFRVNPVMIMHQMNNMAYASVEQLLLAHDVHTLGPWFERFEQSAEVSLLTRAEIDAGYQVELVDRALNRSTAKENAQTLAILKQNGVITGNEMREAVGLARVDEATLESFEPAAYLYGQQPTTGE